jgi:LPS export ABC transporter protein LptC
MHSLRTFFILIALAGLLASCENSIEEVKNLTVKNDLPMRTAHDAEILYSDSAKVKVKLTAPVMDQYVGKDPKLELPKGVDVNFYNDSMRATTHLTANYAIRKDRDGLMEARNNVVVINAKGEKLNTEKLIWDEKNRKIYTDAHVFITSLNGDVLEGNGLTANEDFSIWKIGKPVGKKAYEETDSSATK